MTYKLTSISQPADPYYGAVSLLLHGDGTNGSTTIVDNSPSPKTVTAVGNAQISTTQSKFGGSSMYFDGTGDCLQSAPSETFRLGNGDFTIECWAYFSALDANTTVLRLDSGSGFNGVLFAHTSSLNCYATSAGSSWDILTGQSLGSVTTGTWYHLCLTRSGSTFRGFLNGGVAFTATSSSSIYQLSPVVRIGAANSGGAIAMNGYIQDLRITKGIARYTRNFTPPTTAFLTL